MTSQKTTHELVVEGFNRQYANVVECQYLTAKAKERDALKRVLSDIRNDKVDWR